MSVPRHPAAIIAAAAAILLAGYAALWTGVSTTTVTRAGFTALFVGGALVGEGHGAGIYERALQTGIHPSLIAPQQGVNLPFINPPAAALVIAPLTLMPLAAAYRVWEAIQLLMLLAAVLIAARY